MSFHGLSSTCSMSEIGLGGRDMRYTKESIIKLINRKWHGYMDAVPHQRQRKAIICNTVYHAAVLKRAHFIEIAQYPFKSYKGCNYLAYCGAAACITLKMRLAAPDSVT